MLTKDTQLFVLGLVVIIGGLVILAAPVSWGTDTTSKVAVGGFIGIVLTYFFGKAVAAQAITEQNGRLERAVDRAVAATPTPHPEG